MKKTILTLFAMAGSVLADGIQSWDVTLTRNNASSITNGNSDLWAGSDGMVVPSFLMEYTVDAYASGGYNVTTICTARGVADSSSERGGLTMLTWLTTNVGIANGKTHYSTSANSMTFAAGDTMRMAFDSVSETAYLYNVTKDTMCFVDMSATVTEENASNYYFTSGVMGVQATLGSTAVWTNYNNDKFTFGKLYDLSSLAGTEQFEVFVKTLEAPEVTPSIPEPATATLSLLALCGLAARRRRK